MLGSEPSVSSNGKRTNSLAFCRTDCHTCVSLGQNCDRRRPQCSTCLSQGRKCGGFATPLSWATERMWTDNSLGKEGRAGENSTRSMSGKNGSSNPSSSRKSCPSREFRFVMGASKPRKRRKAPSASQREKTSPSAVEDRRPSPTDSDRDIPATSEGEFQLPNNDQTGTYPSGGVESHDLTVPSPNPTTFLGDDLNLFDGIVPSGFSPVPFFGLNMGEPSSTEVSSNMRALSTTPPLNAMETTAENPLDRHQSDPLMPDMTSALVESAPSNHLNYPRNDLRIHDISMPYISSPINALGLSNIFRHEHDNLLQMCMASIARLKKLKLTRTQMTPSSAFSH